jgi:carbon-monoxide dehydrogenase small subunit
MLMAATALLKEIPKPTEEEIRQNLEGNLCRCTGYEMIVRSVQWAADNPDGVPVAIGESS